MKLIVILLCVLFFSSCESKSKIQAEAVALDFLENITQGNHEELIESFSDKQIQVLEKLLKEALTQSAKKDREKALVDILFGRDVSVEVLNESTGIDLLRLLVVNDLRRYKIQNFRIVGSVCESEDKCYVITKISREDVNGGDEFTRTIEVIGYPDNINKHVSLNFFGLYRAMRTYAKI